METLPLHVVHECPLIKKCDLIQRMILRPHFHLDQRRNQGQRQSIFHRIHGLLAESRHQFTECRIHPNMASEADRVRKRSQNRFGSATSVCMRRQKKYVALPAITCQQGLEQSTKYGKCRHLAFPRETSRCGRSLRIQKRDLQPCASLLRICARFRHILRQRQWRPNTAKIVFPPCQSSVFFRTGQQALLQFRIHGKLHRRTIPIVLSTAHGLLILLLQLLQKQSGRPAIDNSMGQRDCQPVALGLQLQQAHAEHASLRQRKPLLPLLIQNGLVRKTLGIGTQRIRKQRSRNKKAKINGKFRVNYLPDLVLLLFQRRP